MAHPAFSVARLIVRFMDHAETNSRRSDGTPTSEINKFVQSVRLLARRFNDLPVGEFGLLKLQSVWGARIENGLAQPTINRRIGRIVRIFNWAVSQQPVPAPVWQALACVRGFQVGRGPSREPDAVHTVAWEAVGAILVHLNPVTHGMILFAWYTEARPGEGRHLEARHLELAGTRAVIHK